MAISKLTLPSAGATNYNNGDVRLLTPNDVDIYTNYNRPSRDLMARDILLVDKLNEVIDEVAGMQSLVYDAIVGGQPGDFSSVYDAVSDPSAPKNIFIRSGYTSSDSTVLPAITGNLTVVGEDITSVWIPKPPTQGTDPSSNNTLSSINVLIQNLTLGAADNSTNSCLYFFECDVALHNVTIRGKGSDIDATGRGMLRFWKSRVVGQGVRVENYPDCDYVFAFLGVTENQSSLQNIYVVPQESSGGSGDHRLPSLVYTHSATNVSISDVYIDGSNTPSLDTSTSVYTPGSNNWDSWWGAVFFLHGKNLSVRNVYVSGESSPDLSSYDADSFFKSNSFFLVHGIDYLSKADTDPTTNVVIENIKGIGSGAWGEYSTINPVEQMYTDYVPWMHVDKAVRDLDVRNIEFQAAYMGAFVRLLQHNSEVVERVSFHNFTLNLNLSNASHTDAPVTLFAFTGDPSAATTSEWNNFRLEGCTIRSEDQVPTGQFLIRTISTVEPVQSTEPIKFWNLSLDGVWAREVGSTTEEGMIFLGGSGGVQDIDIHYSSFQNSGFYNFILGSFMDVLFENCTFRGNLWVALAADSEGLSIKNVDMVGSFFCQDDVGSNTISRVVLENVETGSIRFINNNIENLSIINVRTDLIEITPSSTVYNVVLDNVYQSDSYTLIQGTIIQRVSIRNSRILDFDVTASTRLEGLSVNDCELVENMETIIVITTPQARNIDFTNNYTDMEWRFDCEELNSVSICNNKCVLSSSSSHAVYVDENNVMIRGMQIINNVFSRAGASATAAIEFKATSNLALYALNVVSNSFDGDYPYCIYIDGDAVTIVGNEFNGDAWDISSGAPATSVYLGIRAITSLSVTAWSALHVHDVSVNSIGATTEIILLEWESSGTIPFLIHDNHIIGNDEATLLAITGSDYPELEDATIQSNSVTSSDHAILVKNFGGIINSTISDNVVVSDFNESYIVYSIGISPSTVQLGPATISGNTVKGHVWTTLFYYDLLGIGTLNSNGLNITGNTVSNTNGSANFFYLEATGTVCNLNGPVDIQGNTLHSGKPSGTESPVQAILTMSSTSEFIINMLSNSMNMAAPTVNLLIVSNQHGSSSLKLASTVFGNVCVADPGVTTTFQQAFGNTAGGTIDLLYGGLSTGGVAAQNTGPSGSSVTNPSGTFSWSTAASNITL